MNELFAGLSKQQTMLLLTAVTFGGQEGVQALDHLWGEQAELLRERALRILQIPREQRVPFLVQEIKRIVTSKKSEGLRDADVERVARALRGERASVIEVLLRALPAQLADHVRLALAHPVIKLSRDIRPDLLAVLRWQLEEKLARTSMPPRVLGLGDLPRLSTAELTALSDVLGARTIAPALAAVGEKERTELLARLSPEQRSVAARPADPGRRMGLGLARRWIAATFVGPDAREAIRDLGVRRIARACLGSAGLELKVIESHRDGFGHALALFVAEERQNPSGRHEEACRSEVLAELERLAARGVIERPQVPALGKAGARMALSRFPDGSSASARARSSPSARHKP
jgi:hypothetical protein